MISVVSDESNSVYVTLSLLQQALSPPITPSELLLGALPVVPMESLDSPPANEIEAPSKIQLSIGQADTLAALVDQCVEASPLPPDSEDALELCSSHPVQDTPSTASASFSPTNQPQVASSQPETPAAQVPGHQPQSLIQPQVLQASLPQLQTLESVPQTQTQIQPQVHVLEAFVSHIQTQASVPQAHPQVVAQDQGSVFSMSVPHHQQHLQYQQPGAPLVPASLSTGAEEPAVQQHTLSSESIHMPLHGFILHECHTMGLFSSTGNSSHSCSLHSAAGIFSSEPAAALVLEGAEFSLDVRPTPPQAAQGLGPLDHLEILQEPSLQPEEQSDCQVRR